VADVVVVALVIVAAAAEAEAALVTVAAAVEAEAASVTVAAAVVVVRLSPSTPRFRGIFTWCFRGWDADSVRLGLAQPSHRTLYPTNPNKRQSLTEFS
jgi:hypothetical protein